MVPTPYRVDPRMLPAVVIALISGVALIVMQARLRDGVLALVVLSPFFYIGLEILARKIVLDEQGITIRKFMRSVRMEWSEVRSLDAVRSGSKLFLIIGSENPGHLLISNTIGSFKDLLDRILERVPPERVEPGAAQLLKEPPAKLGVVIQAWLVCLILTGIVVGKMLL